MGCFDSTLPLCRAAAPTPTYPAPNEVNRALHLFPHEGCCGGPQRDACAPDLGSTWKPPSAGQEGRGHLLRVVWGPRALSMQFTLPPAHSLPAHPGWAEFSLQKGQLCHAEGKMQKSPRYIMCTVIDLFQAKGCFFSFFSLLLTMSPKSDPERKGASVWGSRNGYSKTQKTRPFTFTRHRKNTRSSD